MNDLIINGIDHSVFDLEWAKRGGVMLVRNTSDFTSDFARLLHRSIHTINGKERYVIVEFFKMSRTKGCVTFVANNHYTEDLCKGFRMATPDECKSAGIEYIEPPMVWRDIESAPDNTAVLVHLVGCNPIVAAYDPEFDVWYDADLDIDINDAHPTHWMPLPQPPKDDGMAGVKNDD